MVGFISFSAPPVCPLATPERSDFKPAYFEGETARRALELTLTVVADDLDDLIARPPHTARFIGTARCPALSDSPLMVTNGVLRLFVQDPTRVTSYRMRYRARLTTAAGHVYGLSGFKDLGHGQTSSLWADLTTLCITLSGIAPGAPPGSDPARGPVVARGILRLAAHDTVRQLLTLRSRHAVGPAQRIDTVARFVLFFLRSVTNIYGGPLAASRYVASTWPTRPRRPLRTNGRPLEGTRVPVQAADGAELRLTRFPGGPKGPVILAPGFGVSALSFAIDTVPQNLVEFLCEKKYDVWLFDYRASPVLAASRTQFTVDDIATQDWPAAVARVRAVTGADTVQVVAHCVGAMTFTMAMLAGVLDGRIRSAICSQIGAHPIGSRLNELKAGLYIGSVLGWLGVQTLRLTVDAAGTRRSGLLDRLLKLYPTSEACANPVCRRVRFVLGESYRHAQLDEATHDALIELFADPVSGRHGCANLRALRHLSRILRRRHVVNRSGDDVYRPRADRLAVPIYFLHGEANEIFVPEGTKTTVGWLRERNPDQRALYDRRVVPGYAHLDCFIGRRAVEDVYPTLLDQLKAYNPD